MIKGSSGVFHIGSRGSLYYLLGGLLLLVLYVINRRQIKMNTINKTGFELRGLLIDEGFDFYTAQRIVSQAAHETANFTSQIFRENNNPFGMKLPEQRRTYATGENRGHAVFASIADAVRDYWLYWQYWRLPNTFKDNTEFVTALKIKGYFTAPLKDYINGVDKYYKIYFA